MATSISDFSTSELTSLAIVTMSIDDIAPSFRYEALEMLDKLANLDEVSQTAFLDAIEALASEDRPKELIAYLRDGGPLVDLREEIFEAIDEGREAG